MTKLEELRYDLFCAEDDAMGATGAGKVVMQHRIDHLQAQIEELMVPTLNIKFGNKQNVTVGGPALGQRFPVTLYADSWLELLKEANVQGILRFIQDNAEGLAWK